MTDSPYVPSDDRFAQPKEKKEPSSHIPGVTNAPPKYIEDRDQWSADACFEYAKSGKKPINPEWKTFRDEALKEAGIEDDDGQPKTLEEMDAGELYERMVKR